MNATTHGIYRKGNTLTAAADCVGVDSDEMPQEAIDHLDFIDNTTFNYLSELTKSAGGVLPWDMELIGAVNDFVISFLKSKAIPIWHPYVSDEYDGTE